MPEYSYEEAYSRNKGLLTLDEQKKLREFVIAIPGMGGVGGAHLIALVRQGFEKFKIADFDVYDIKNFNRQFGARMDTLGRNKAEVMREEALKINPNCSIEIFPAGISPDNMDQFLDGVDLGVDGLDVFVFDIRRTFFMKAHQKGIPVVTAGPIGFGSAYLIFMPEGPTFDQYFAVSDEMPEMKKLSSFFLGLMPGMLQAVYMREVNLKAKLPPSSISGVNLASGIVNTLALKILLKKGKIYPVPYSHQFDVMRNKYVRKRLWFGNHGPWQKIKIYIALYLYSR
jgi:molybdopterin/thiamine biosynthesis adenylyltransferase